jgi:hypothetical protein
MPNPRFDVGGIDCPIASRNEVWDVNTLAWVKMTQPGSGGGAGGDVNVTNASLAVTGPLTNTELRAAAVPVSGTFWPATQPVSGTFWQSTQPVSLASVPTHAVTQSGAWAVTVTKVNLTANAPAAASVGISSAQALAANANRKGLILINTSQNTISVAFGATAVLNSGITLDSGASWTMTDYTHTTAAVNAIAAAGSSNLAIQEFQ